MSLEVGCATPCAPPTAWGSANGAHGVTGPAFANGFKGSRRAAFAQGFLKPNPIGVAYFPLLVNRNAVVVRKVSPGRSTVEGNCDLFGESGKCCVSKHTPP